MLDTQMLSPGESVDDPLPEAVGYLSSRGHGGHSSGVAGPQDLDQLTKNDHACRALWSAVVIRALKDLFRIGTVNNQNRKYGNSIQYQRYASAKMKTSCDRFCVPTR